MRPPKISMKRKRGQSELDELRLQVALLMKTIDLLIQVETARDANRHLEGEKQRLSDEAKAMTENLAKLRQQQEREQVAAMVDAVVEGRQHNFFH